MLFKRLTLEGWQQFGKIDIAFHPRLTVITGANGAGKTTILRLLARHFGWQFQSLLTPRRSKSRGWRYLATFLFPFKKKDENQEHQTVGRIEYKDGLYAEIRIPAAAQQPNYQPNLSNSQPVAGLFLPSHRPEFRYQRVQTLNLNQRNWEVEAFELVNKLIRQTSEGGGGQSSSFRMKEILVSLAIFGYGSEAMQPDPYARELYEGFQDILRKVIPSSVGFRCFELRDRSEVVLVTDSGIFLLDAVSGGVAAIIEMSWMIFMFSQQQKEQFVVVIDEPENHLHASMQRSLMPSFVSAFPKAQFVIATHSPLFIGSVKDSEVYALRFDTERLVYSERLDLLEKAGSAEEILAEVLEVDVTVPIWAEEGLKGILEDYLKSPLTKEKARKMREELDNAGLLNLIPNAYRELRRMEEEHDDSASKGE